MSELLLLAVEYAHTRRKSQTHHTHTQARTHEPHINAHINAHAHRTHSRQHTQVSRPCHGFASQVVTRRGLSKKNNQMTTEMHSTGVTPGGWSRGCNHNNTNNTTPRRNISTQAAITDTHTHTHRTHTRTHARTHTHTHIHTQRERERERSESKARAREPERKRERGDRVCVRDTEFEQERARERESERARERESERESQRTPGRAGQHARGQASGHTAPGGRDSVWPRSNARATTSAGLVVDGNRAWAWRAHSTFYASKRREHYHTPTRHTHTTTPYRTVPRRTTWLAALEAGLAARKVLRMAQLAPVGERINSGVW